MRGAKKIIMGNHCITDSRYNFSLKHAMLQCGAFIGPFPKRVNQFSMSSCMANCKDRGPRRGGRIGTFSNFYLVLNLD